MAIDALTDCVSDGQVQFLRTGDGLGGNYEGEIHLLPKAPSTPGKKGDSVHSSVSRRRRRPEKILRLSARGVEKEKITLPGQCLDLTSEHVLESEVVGAGREDRRVGREGQST